MSDRRGKFSHRHDPSYVRQLRLCLAQGLFRAAAFLARAKRDHTIRQIIRQLRELLDRTFIKRVRFFSVKNEGAKRFAIRHQWKRDVRTIAALERFRSPRSDTQVGLDTLRPGWLAGSDSSTRRSLTSFRILPGSFYAFYVALIVSCLRHRPNRLFSIKLAVT